MKKLKYISVIVLFAVLLTSLAFAGCDNLGLHVHSYDGYQKNDTVHWRVCKVCKEQTSEEAHNFDEWVVQYEATEDSDGQRYHICKVCNFTEFETIPMLGSHTHDYSGGWKYNSTHHYKQCSKCDSKTEQAAHSFGSWVVDQEPTETKAGSRHKTCSICNYVENESIDPTGQHEHSYGDEYISANATQHYQECNDCGYKNYSNHNMPTNWVVDVEATTTHPGHKYRECINSCGYVEEDTIPQLSEQRTGSIDFYAINDFHGEYGKLAQISGYIYDKINNTNTVAINSGDMFQGSMESNWNYGSLFAECMDIAGFDAFTYGNHEFDWGLDNLRSLSSNSLTPFLGANIYNWNANSRTWGDFAEDLAQEYVIKELDNGLRVGIIGIIGKDQITSISSQLVQTIGFKDPKDIVPGLSEKLRNDLNCDVVVVSAHTGPETFLDDSSWDITKYADAVLCAHTHSAETYIQNGVPFVQGGSYGSYVSHVKLTVDANGNVSCDTYENISYSRLSGINSTVKNQVQTKIDNSNAQIAEEANEVLATLSGGSLDYKEGVARLVCHAIAEYATAQGYNIELAMVNKARSSLSAGNVTYTSLYEAIPFDNVVYIAKVSGADIIKEAGYSDQSIWRVSGTKIENSSSKYYDIAVIDYLLYHQNSNRYYDYFPSAFKSGFTPVALEKADVEMYNYRFITRDFLRKSGSIASSTYTVVNDHTNKSLLENQVDLSGGVTTPTDPTHAGTLADPYSVTDALLIAAQYTNKNSASAGYVTGTVSNINNASLSDSSGDLYNFYLTDSSGNKILIYYVSKFNGATSSNNWTSTSDLKNGDTLVMYAQYIYTYINSNNGSSTPETYNGYVVSINGVATK